MVQMGQINIFTEVQRIIVLIHLIHSISTKFVLGIFHLSTYFFYIFVILFRHSKNVHLHLLKNNFYIYQSVWYVCCGSICFLLTFGGLNPLGTLKNVSNTAPHPSTLNRITAQIAILFIIIYSTNFKSQFISFPTAVASTCCTGKQFQENSSFIVS